MQNSLVIVVVWIESFWAGMQNSLVVVGLKSPELKNRSTSSSGCCWTEKSRAEK
jgi:hypothetical protein